MESRLEKIFSMGINIMSLAVWLGEDRKRSAAAVGLLQPRFQKHRRGRAEKQISLDKAEIRNWYCRGIKPS